MLQILDVSDRVATSICTVHVEEQHEYPSGSTAAQRFPSAPFLE